MLLRMLSACAPCIGYWINPTAYSGQDQDPSNETIVGSVHCSAGIDPIRPAVIRICHIITAHPAAFCLGLHGSQNFTLCGNGRRWKAFHCNDLQCFSQNSLSTQHLEYNIKAH